MSADAKMRHSTRPADRSFPLPSRMTTDVRLDALSAWMGVVLQAPILSIEPASVDASFRRYFRVTLDGAHSLTAGAAPRETLIAMDAPPPKEDCRPFVKVARMLAAAGVHSPAVLAEALDDGFLLLSDLGNITYLAALTEQSAPALYGDACAALIDWQLASTPDSLPPYDEALLKRELELFPDWYVARHIGVALDAAQTETLGRVFRRVLDNNLAQGRVYVHRDYHSRNLMVASPNPGVLDFQDAVYGPVTYDLVSLLRDAYVEWDEALQIDWAARYWQRARAAALPVAADFGAFWRDFEWMGVQRQLKVLGIFARLYHRDGKDAYLKEMPRVMRYLRAACGRYDELSPLLRLLDELEARQPAVGYTF
jgi:aminoglycoside/choline kinase family phosphotransferase